MNAWTKCCAVVERGTHTRLAITAWRILQTYVALQLTHLIFYIYNYDLVGDVATEEIWLLFKGSILFDNASIIYSLSLFILLSILPLPLRIWQSKGYRRAMFWAYVIPVAVMLAFNFGDIIYFHYTQKRCTADEIFFAENGNTALLMGRFMLDNWYLVIVCMLLLALLVVGYRRKFEVRDIVSYAPSGERPRGGTRVKRIALIAVVRLLVIALVALYSIYGVRGGLTRMTRPITLSNAMLYTTTPNKAYLILSNPFCVIRTVSNRVEIPRFYDKEEVECIFSPTHNPATMTRSDMYGIVEGYNVVVFILESFSAEHSALLMPEEHTGEGYTPNLDKIMSEGLLLERCYANGLTSIAAPPTIWSSMPSYGEPFMLRAESLTAGSALPRILADKGYDTAFFCGSEHGSMGFGAYAHIAGVERLYSMDTYAERYGNDAFDGFWGIWDEPFMQYMGEELSTLREPFFASIFTITSHHPFNIPREARAELPAGTTLNHQPVAYTDRAIGRFMESVCDEAWFDHTLFIFVADHVSSERMAERTLSIPGCYHIVGAMSTPDGKLPAQRYDHVSAQVDIMPTVLGLVGNEEPYFAMGRDIFNEPEREPFIFIHTGFGYAAIGDDYVADFDGESIVAAYRHDDYKREHNILAEIDGEAVERLSRATLQQYMTHLKEVNFLP